MVTGTFSQNICKTRVLNGDCQWFQSSYASKIRMKQYI